MQENKKEFDCIEMKRQGQKKLLEEVKGMTADEEYAYWKEKEKSFIEEQKEFTRQREAQNKAQEAA